MDHEPLRYIPEPEHAVLLEAPKGWHFSRAQKAVIVGVFVIVALVLGQGLFAAPAAFPKDTVLAVANGETLSGVTGFLQAKHAIRSPFVFKSLMTVFGGSKGLVAGDYYLKERQGVIGIAWRLTHGAYDIQDVRITIPEGYSSKDIAAAFTATGKFVHFDAAAFNKLAAPYEGYLFPDTYYFLPSVTATSVVSAMTDNYQKRIATIAPEIAAFKRPIKDIITMASIIEREARTDESRRTIAGILWKRLDQGIPLQVDAAFSYVNGKTKSSDLTLDDLKIDSPYNTYVHKGLPPGPIANPGLAAIKDTVTPIATKYYFYLSDADGNMHYAVTHDEHVANKQKYLK